MSINNKKDLRSLLNKLQEKTPLSSDIANKLSLCMIVKNEESNIERCLKSVKDIVDEIVVVDTGSTDRTVEIAKECGANVYYYEWTNDFASARNYSIDKSTGDWILVLDADEELDKRSEAFLGELKTNSKITTDSFNIIIKNLNERGLVSFDNKMERLFKKSANIRYQGKIHEYLTAESTDITEEQIRIIHYGYKNKEITELKEKERNLPILKNSLNTNINHENLKSKLYLAQSYLSLKDYNLAESYFKEYINDLKLSGSNQVPSIAYFSLMSMKVDTHEFDELQDLLNRAYNSYGVKISSYGDYWYFKALIERNSSNYSQSLKYFLEAIKSFKKNHYNYETYLSDKTRYYLALYYLCELYINKQDYKNLYIYAKEILNSVMTPYIRELLYNLLENIQFKNSKNSVYKKIETIRTTLSKEFSKNQINDATSNNLNKLSLCMIVKNEESNIERCLKSVKDIVDEIVVVDTGSTDRTVEIAKECGANVYYYEWTNDFAAARNYSIDKSTGDWILVLDADEELISTDKQKLNSMLINVDGDICFNVLIKNISKYSTKSFESEHYMSRLFNKTKNNRFVGKVHEGIVQSQSIYLDPQSLYIVHHGYKDKDFTDKKQKERNLPLLEQIIDEEKDDISQEKISALYYLSIMKIEYEEYEKAEDYLLKILEFSNKVKFFNTFLAAIYCNLMFIYFITNNNLKLDNIIKTSEGETPLIKQMSTYWFYKGLINQNSDKKLAVEYYIKSLEVKKDEHNKVLLNFLSELIYFYSILKICECAILMDDKTLLNKYITIYETEADKYPNYLINLSMIYFDLKEYDKVLDLNNKVLKELNKNNTSDIISKLNKSALNNISKVYMIRKEYDKAFRTQLLLHEYNDIKEQWYKLGNLLESQGNINDAQTIYTTIISHVNNDYYPYLCRAYINFMKSDYINMILDLDKAYDLTLSFEEKVKVIKSYIKFNSLDKAEQKISKIKGENEYQANLLLSEIYIIRKDFEKAELILLETKNKYEYNIHSYIELANLYLNLNKECEALDILNQGLKIEKNNLDIIYLISTILLMKQDYIEAQKYIDIGLKLSKRNDKFLLLNEEINILMQ